MFLLCVLPLLLMLAVFLIASTVSFGFEVRYGLFRMYGRFAGSRFEIGWKRKRFYCWF